MATRVPKQPTAVVLAHSDGLLERLARELLRLEHHAAAIDSEAGKRRAALIAGLASRDVTRLDVGGLHVRRVGLTGVSVHATVPR